MSLPEKVFSCKNLKAHCGGCPLAELPYAEQLAQKQAQTQRLLGKFGRVQPILGAAEPQHYRNKATATFATGPRGTLICGTYAAGSHRVLPLCDCALLDARLNETLQAVLAAAKACHYTPFDEDEGTGLLRHVQLRLAKSTGQVLVTLVTPGEHLPGSRNFTTALRKAAPWVTSVVQNVNPKKTSAVLGPTEKTLYGPGYVVDALCGLKFAISSRSFYQVNPAQTERLYAAALAAAGLTGSETVVDAYCGTGTIGLCAAQSARRVIGVEQNPAAVRDAAANARRNRIQNARFVCDDATRWMLAAAEENLRPDVVFLDPPRAGSTPECIAALGRMRPARIVYVSCDQTTLARDLALLTAQGYRAATLQPVDMFPMTGHVETVCLLSKLRCQQHIEVELDMNELDLTAAEKKATYEEIKEYVLEHSGLKVSNLYIAQVKQKCGIIERENYNKAKSEDARHLKCPAEKEKAIREALVHFGMTK